LIDWVLARQRGIVRGSRFIVAGCAFALIGIASLPRNAIDRILAIVGLTLVAFVFFVWLAVVALTIAHPGLFRQLRERRASVTGKRPEEQ
jgi:lipopolysaccharide/colanic/teichoic acid biosynthesis glycosyltransferase